MAKGTTKKNDAQEEKHIVSEEEFENNRAKDILKKNLIANVHILHGGKQYKPGEILPCFDIEMVELWCLHRSAHWE